MSFKRYRASEQAILTTILYSDIFSFPVTKDELWKFLISPQKITRKEFDKALHSLAQQITFQDNYFCLKGKEKSIVQRKKNLTAVEQKMQRALWITQRLSRIPSLLFIGISGGLAVGNATKNDDIDLVIIVKKNTLFQSRLLVLIVLEILGVRRSRNQKYPANTICVNLLFDETQLGWFAKQQDIYTAREVGQMVPLFERKGIYKKFLSANSWISDFLPNIKMSSLQKQRFLWIPDSHKGTSFYKGSVAVRDDSVKVKFLELLFVNTFFELLSRQLQVRFMNRHRTNEIIKNSILAFHPYDYRIKTLKQLRLKMRQFGLLTKI